DPSSLTTEQLSDVLALSDKKQAPANESELKKLSEDNQKLSDELIQKQNELSAEKQKATETAAETQKIIKDLESKNAKLPKEKVGDEAVVERRREKQAKAEIKKRVESFSLQLKEVMKYL